MFSLQGVAKDWLYYLEPNYVTSWNDMKRVFLERFVPASELLQLENIYVVLDRLIWNHWPNTGGDLRS